MVKSGDIENVKWVLEGGSKFKPKESIFYNIYS
jgi:hypothetical protein